MAQRDPDALTPREREVIELIRLGLTNEEIAERLGITLDGAKYHVSQILSKLGVTTREEAAAVEAAKPPVRARQPQRWWAAWPLAAKAAGAAVVVTAVAGLGVLAWGVFETSETDDERSAQVEPTSNAPPSVAAVLGPKELTAFRMCAERANWRRPSEDEMQAVWQSPGYANVPLQDKRLTLGESFFWYDDPDTASTFAHLSGMDSGPSGEERAACEFEGTVELWTLQYQVMNVEYLGGTLYRVHVDPTENGWRAVRFGRTGGTVDPSIAVVGPDQSIMRCLGNPERCDQIAADWTETLAIDQRIPPAVSRQSSASYAVEIAIPAIWESHPRYSGGTSEDPWRYSDPRGSSFGVVQLNACCTGQTIDEVLLLSTEHKHKPYGDNPSVESLTIPAGDARLITADATAPDPLAAELIVKYPRPVQIAGAEFDFFLLYAHKDFIRSIATTLEFTATATPAPR